MAQPASNPLADMSDSEVRRLKRVDLLEMLVEQSREIERLRAELAAAQARLVEREITISNCGSIAEAALELNGVFQAAQAAADQYLHNVRAAVATAGSDAPPHQFS